MTRFSNGEIIMPVIWVQRTDLGVRLRTQRHVKFETDVAIVGSVEGGRGAVRVEKELGGRQEDVGLVVETRLERASVARQVHLWNCCTQTRFTRV